VASMAIYFTSDTHFGHGGALGLYRRPFASVAAMNEALVEAVERDVGSDDVSGISAISPFASAQQWSRSSGLAQRRKHLVTGNQRSPATMSTMAGESVQPYAEIAAEGVSLVLCLPVSQLARHGQGLDQSARPQPRSAEARPRQFDVRRRRLGVPPGHAWTRSCTPPVTGRIGETGAERAELPEGVPNRRMIECS